MRTFWLQPLARRAVAALLVGLAVSASSQEPVKTKSTLYPPDVAAAVRANAAAHPWAAQARDSIHASAESWMALSHDQLWDLMFGPAVTRSWMVWSNGHCPACKESVPMYTWRMDALKRPWKVWCPHCAEAFPKNDFAAFHASGMDKHGVFDPARADRSLLFNAEHPDPGDPLHLFGVDDGEGYAEGEHRWRFIGAYLIYGQFKQAIIGGIRTLAAAHVLTGEPAYARRAAILLDRVADLYPTFDFGEQGLVYEVKGAAGYVTTWHDACEETREMVMAYDMIFDAIRHDDELVGFLSQKARRFGLANPKSSFLDIQRNIEDRILRDALANRPKINTNYPRTEIAVAVIYAVLGMPDHEAPYWEVVGPMLDRATAVDGVTGEKGLSGYSYFTIQALASFLGEFSKSDPAFLADAIARHPRLKETFRFFMDTRCLEKYYPASGDCGAFARPVGRYVGMNFVRPGAAPHQPESISWTALPPSMFSLMGRFYDLTGDSAYIQTLYEANEHRIDGLPYDLYAADTDHFQQRVRDVIAVEGTLPRLGCVNKQEWHIAILRSGHGSNARAVWLDYDSGGGHGHADGMNLGLFARGLDLMPDFGYPPVQFGGWGSPRARWYTMTAAHNTVVVDGANTTAGAGRTTLWTDARLVKAVRADGPAMNQRRRYERTVALVDISETDFYVFDLFRVAGGSDHTKFVHSHFGSAVTQGLELAPAEDYGHDTQMRDFRSDPAPAPGWAADWTVEDRYGLLAEGARAHLQHIELTEEAEGGLAEAWLVAGLYNSNEETWIPRVFVRRRAADGRELSSCFVAVKAPHEGAPVIAAAERLRPATPDGVPLGDSHVAVAVSLADGRRDVIIAIDPEAPPAAGTLHTAAGVTTDAEFCVLRFSSGGEVEYAVLCNGAALSAGALRVALDGRAACWEWSETGE